MGKEEETPSHDSSSTMRYRCIPVYGRFELILLSLACVPAAFGNTICSYILHSLSQKSYT